jgi:hypothetical protein
MTITELIKRLEHDLKDLGDVRVIYFDHEDGFLDLDDNEFSSLYENNETKLVIT